MFCDVVKIMMISSKQVYILRLKRTKMTEESKPFMMISKRFVCVNECFERAIECCKFVHVKHITFSS